MNLQFKFNDPDKETLYNLLIMSTIMNKNLFLVQQDLVFPAACLLEMVKKTNSTSVDFIKLS